MPIESVGFLAAGWSLASPESHATSVALQRDNETILVDAGGQVTRGLVASFGTADLTDVYLTHEHPDHTYALPGLIHHLRFAEPREVLRVHGPEPALAAVKGAIEALGVTCPFDLEWVPLDVEGGGNENATWAPTEHSVPTLAYRFGDVVVCGDTSPTQNVIDLARGASLLIHEATHFDEDKTHSTGHSTPADAVRAAREAKAGALAMIHVHPEVSDSDIRGAVNFEPVFLPRDGDLLDRAEEGWSMR